MILASCNLHRFNNMGGARWPMFLSSVKRGCLSLFGSHYWHVTMYSLFRSLAVWSCKDCVATFYLNKGRCRYLQNEPQLLVQYASLFWWPTGEMLLKFIQCKEHLCEWTYQINVWWFIGFNVCCTKSDPELMLLHTGNWLALIQLTL